MNDITKEPTDECCGKKPVELTLEEAIAHAEECINDTPCGQIHKQLADWLKELKDYRCFPNRKQRQRLHMSEQAANEKKWEQCTGDAIAWLGLDVDMDIKEIADWLDALVESGGCGFGSGDAFGASSNSLATWVSSLADKIRKVNSSCHVLSSPHKGKWENGTMYEYEYAYCSECGHMQWAGWDSHREAEDNIEEFAHNYKFCPGCGAEMEGGVYVR